MKVIRLIMPAILFFVAACKPMPWVPDPHHEIAHASARWSMPVEVPQAQFGTPQTTAPAPPSPLAAQSINLPQAIQIAIRNNLRVQIGMEKVQEAQADLITDSLLPNPELFTDYQLIPLQYADINNQAGPPQFDALFTFPIDWCLFGKRVANMEVSRWGIEVAQAELADLLRHKVADTVQAFYDLLEAKELVKLAQADLTDLERIADLVKKQVEKGLAPAMESEKVKLAALEARRELRKREADMKSARARLGPLLGSDDYDIHGTLAIRAALPAPKLEDALAIAERNRPDLRADQFAIQQAEAAITKERKKAWPMFQVIAGYDYQQQNRILGFRDANLFTFGLNMGLPITDRNQGHIAKAESFLRSRLLTYRADLQDVRSELQQALVAYENALHAVTEEDPDVLVAAKKVRDSNEAAFKAGQRSMHELLESQKEYRDQVRTILHHQADYWRALNKLYAVLGTPLERK